MQENDDLLDHINKVKTLADQLIYLKAPVISEDIEMTLLERLPPLYKYLITILEMMSMKELIIEYITSRSMHEMSKRKEK